jgi:hypothetical protein
LFPYSDSVYKTPKTHFDLLLLKTATREEKKLLSIGNSKEKREGFMVSPVLHSVIFQAASNERIVMGWVTVVVYRRTLNIQRPKLNYSHVIHPTSESSM